MATSGIQVAPFRYTVIASRLPTKLPVCRGKQNSRRRRRAGFTLVEIMIVTGIIALLATLALPGYLRSRKRAQASAILNDARVINSAMDQYALENNKMGNDSVAVNSMKQYFKPATRLYKDAASGAGLTDVLGNNFSFSTFDGGVRINNGTVTNFSDVIENASSFWGSYY